MHKGSGCFLLQLLLIIGINWLSHPATFNPTLPSSQYQNMGLKRIPPSHNLVCVCSTGSAPFLHQNNFWSFQWHIRFLTITSSFHGFLSALRSLTRAAALIIGGAPGYWSPAGFIHFIHFIKSIFSRIVKAMWAEQKEKQAMTDGNPCPSTRGAASLIKKTPFWRKVKRPHRDCFNSRRLTWRRDKNRNTK